MSRLIGRTGQDNEPRRDHRLPALKSYPPKTFRVRSFAAQWMLHFLDYVAPLNLKPQTFLFMMRQRGFNRSFIQAET